jgi:hypothetical protein
VCSELHIHGSGYFHFRAYTVLVKAILLDRIKWICKLSTLLFNQISAPSEGFGFGLQVVHMDDLNLVVLAGCRTCIVFVEQ